MDLSKLIGSLVLFGIGFAGGILTAFGKGWVDDQFKKGEEDRKEVKFFVGQVVDLIAIVTPSNYSSRPRGNDQRRIQRAAFQLERLGKVKLASSIRSYMNKWNEVYTISNPPFKVPLSKEDEKRILNLIKDLDNLTDLILKGK